MVSGVRPYTRYVMISICFQPLVLRARAQVFVLWRMLMENQRLCVNVGLDILQMKMADVDQV